MSRAEKRYFKLYTGRHLISGQSNTQVLFDAIAAMDVYDENALIEKFRGQSFTRRFAITKRRLYETILKSLDAYHAEGSLDVKAYRLLHQVEILHRKALYEDAAKLLHSARRLAQQHGRSTILMEVLQWERRLLECGNYSSTHTSDLERISAESNRIRKEQTEVDHLWEIKSRVLMDLYRKGQARDKDALAAIQLKLKDPLLKDPLKLLTPRAKFLFHHLHSATAYARNDLDTCRDHLLRNRELLNSNKDHFSDDKNIILGVLSNLVHVSSRLGHFSGSLDLLKEYRTAPTAWDMPETDDLELKLFSTTSSLELALHCRSGSFDKALRSVGRIEKGLDDHADGLGPLRRAGLFYQLAYAHFGVGQLDKALQWTNRLLNDTHVRESAEIVCFGRMLDLLVQVEIGKKDLVPYTLRNTERFFRSRDRVYRYEQHFLEMMKGTIKARDRSELERTWNSFLASMRQLENDPMEQVVFDHFDPIAWVESKLTDRPFPELVKERSQRTIKAA